MGSLTNIDPDDLGPAIAVARARFDEWLDARRQRDMLELKLQEVTYQSALAVTARVLQPTLMDFLR